ncbi:unnamed protein product [Lactuca virosa]|uniref:KOW domain-containing protein n=1 Tax=Lactuca virosa TaxID=75947 RepID=A0AAU9M0W0_9ASTR|nr:unnamed protein product [Lactuca virosa]
MWRLIGSRFEFLVLGLTFEFLRHRATRTQPSLNRQSTPSNRPSSPATVVLHWRFPSIESFLSALSLRLHPERFWHTMGWKAAQKLIHHWKILRGDNVMIIRGKDRGETGTIKRVIRSQNRVIVEGKNLVKKHIKQGQGHEGGIFTVEAPLHVSNVQIVDPVTKQPCKVGIRYQEDGSKVRVSRGIGASGSIIPRPEILKIRATPRPTIAGPKDTPMELVLEKTFDAKTGKGMPDL